MLHKHSREKIMPKVVINMEMPKSCSTCGFCSYNDGEGFAEDYYNCVINGQFLGIEPPYNKRHQECPLQEVKE